MKYEGKLPVLRQYPDQAFNTGDVDFQVDGQILSIPALPFTMLNLKENADKVISCGWEFFVGKVRFFVTGEQMHLALSRYFDEQRNIRIERFFDPYEHC
jgi:hypothetical protein